MTLRPAACATLALFTLAACSGGGGPSVTGSAGESARTESTLSSLWEKARGLTVEQTKTVEMPAFALIADAFAGEAAKRNMEPSQVRQILLSRDGNAPPPSVLAHVDEFTTSINAKPEAANFRPGETEHFTLALPLHVATGPMRAWEVNPMNDGGRRDPFDTPFFRNSPGYVPRPRYDGAMHLGYMRMLAVSAAYANGVYGEIAQRLGGTTLADPDAAKARVIEVYNAIPPAVLRAKLADAERAVADARFVTDLTGSGNVHFVANGVGDFVGDARGVVWTKNGMTWFGDGRINGQVVNFRLASTASLSERQAQSGSTGATSGADVSGGGSIGAGR